MKPLSQLLRAPPADWWRRRDRRDTIVILSSAVLAYILAHFNELPLKLFQFGLDHADWEFDDLIFMVFVMSAPMIVYGFRRYQDVSHEIKARISAELEARNLARHDPLTGLPNRRFFAEKLDECLRGADATQQSAVLVLDIDGLKLVNDLHGHRAGDHALSEFACRVAVLLRGASVLARTGGHEFAIIMPRIHSLDGPTNLARRIAAAVAEPFVIDGTAAEFAVG